MLDDKTLDELFDRLNIATAGRERIRWIRENAPIRDVGGGTHNVVVRFSSKKMGFVLKAEAFNTEYAAFEDYDNDPSVLEFYPQPCRLKIKYVNASGKLVHPYITPDIFVVCREYFAFVECKTEEELLRLAKEQPNRFTVDADGNWRSPPAEAAAALIGCRFILRSTKDNNWVALENYEFFSEYLSVDPSDLKIAPDALIKVEKRLSESSWLTVADLLSGEEPIDADSLYGLIAIKKIHFDFLSNRISNPDQALVFRDEISAKAYQTIARNSVGLKTPTVTPLDPVPGRRFVWDGKAWQIVNTGELAISAMPLHENGGTTIIELRYEVFVELARNGKIVPVPPEKDNQEEVVVQILRETPTNKLETASWRYQILFGVPDKGNPLVSRSPRAKAYWLSEYRRSELEFGNGFVGLIPNRDGTQGNHDPKTDPQSRQLAEDAYVKYWENDAQRSVALCHGIYLNDCQAKGVEPLSLKSFQDIVDGRRSHQQKLKRKGEKAAYDEEPPYLVLEYTTPRHGNRPFHYGHIDHTPLPIKVKDRSGKFIVRTIWLTLLVDAFSRYVLAIYLSFDPPSFASCMMVIRECVRKHGRIPHWIVVDNGSDFNSKYFETLLGKLCSHKKFRPKGKAKFGSVIERLFRTTVDQFISNLLGATHDMNPRQVGKDVDPELKAIWTYERLWVRLEEYLRNVYHKNHHSTIGNTPEAALVLGIQTFGARAHAIFSYDENFIILTCPSTPKGTAKVTAKGVKINYLYYWSDLMKAPGVLRSRLEVRYDPFNRGIAYVFLQGGWQKCYSEYYAIFQHYTEKQIRIASNHLRMKSELNGKQATINAQNLASFLTSEEADSLLQMQRLHESESAVARSSINTPNDRAVPAPESEQPAIHPPMGVAITRPTLLEEF